ncbi:hypothetical protein ABPG73_016980 [Tetrahymena malaccensis]
MSSSITSKIVIFITSKFLDSLRFYSGYTKYWKQTKQLQTNVVNSIDVGIHFCKIKTQNVTFSGYLKQISCRFSFRYICRVLNNQRIQQQIQKQADTLILVAQANFIYQS